MYTSSGEKEVRLVRYFCKASPGRFGRSWQVLLPVLLSRIAAKECTRTWLIGSQAPISIVGKVTSIFVWKVLEKGHLQVLRSGAVIC